MKRATLGVIFVSMAACSLIGCGVASREGEEPKEPNEGVSQPERDDYLPTDTILAQMEAPAGKDLAREVDHTWDDRVVPADQLDDPENRFQSEETEGTPGPLKTLASDRVPTIDLRRFAKITDQTNEGSCTAYAVAGAMQILANTTGVRDDMSAQHLWNLQGKQPNTVAALNTALQKFIAPLDVWPNGGHSRPRVQSPNSHGFARLGAASSIPQGLANVMSHLAKKKPVVMASTLNDSWRYMGSRGIIDPSARPSGSWVHAAHAYDLVGYVEDDRFEDGGYFIVKNSWGPRWGDHGYAYMPFSYCRHQRARADRGFCLFYAVDDVELKSAAAAETAPASGSYAAKVVYGELQNGHRPFRLKVEASAADLAKVQSVTYDVHPTFGSGATTTATNAATGFATPTYVTSASGWSTRGTKIRLKTGQTIALPGSTIRWR